MQREAMRWSYSLRNRERWNTRSDAVEQQQRDIRAVAASMGITARHAEQMVGAGLVEVDIPWSSEEQDWELRIFPWEYMLAAVTRGLRGDRPFTVVRRLRVERPRGSAPVATWLHVLSAPGRLEQEYDFTSEHELLQLSAKSLECDFRLLKNPDEEALATRVRDLSPDVIHLSGFDSHQGLALLDPDRRGDGQDGYVVRSSGNRGRPVVIDAVRLASMLTSGESHAPALIAFNLYNSASRIAPLCVVQGASATVGFQDSFDDALAELFFATLYRAWPLAGWDVVSAFEYAWQTARNTGQPLQGSAVVLWSGRSILDRAYLDEGLAGERRQDGIRKQWREKLSQAPSAETIRSQMEVDVDPISQLNYSILHNNGPIFKRFRIRKKDASLGRVEGLLVNVDLYVGADSYPFRMETSIDETVPQVDLLDIIRVSLASALSRTIRESIHTSLFVEVMWKDAVLYRRTHRVTLLPVDEWRFDSSNYRWLPSFVLPRDPAVRRIVDAAQRYLMALRDDPAAGFDGYQCVDYSGKQPGPDDCSGVDLQVRALWSALLYESPLSYINPPPSFTESSQRLRTPSDCVEGKRGTCIDLALLLAACLEYVEIYPTIFLLKTHAFPAYWRHDSFHEEFRVARIAALDVDRALDRGQPSLAQGQRCGWDFQPDQYREILGAVQAGRLVPLESTLVTGHGCFGDAISDGIQNLASRREFESMIDILLARSDDKTSVTPLPIRRGEA
jgi:hypothetical protein